MVKEARNELSKDIVFYKGKLSAIGIGYDDEHANLKVPSSGESTQPFKWNWLTSTTGSNSDQVEAFKKIIEVLEAKNNPDLYQKLVSELNANTKNALDDNIKQYNITVPTQQTNDQKVTLINGKEVEFKKFLELLYKENTKEFDLLLKMLPSETSEVMKKEVTLKLAYDYFKGSKNFDDINTISERIGTSDIFEEYLGFNIDQFKSEEMNIMGGDQYSYLDFSA